MNEIVLVSVITSCVWAVGILVACMYWRIKKIVDGNQQEINLRIDEIYRNMNQEVSEIGKQIDDVYRTIDSRVDKLTSKLESQLPKDCECLSSISNK